MANRPSKIPYKRLRNRIYVAQKGLRENQQMIDTMSLSILERILWLPLYFRINWNRFLCFITMLQLNFSEIKWRIMWIQEPSKRGWSWWFAMLIMVFTIFHLFDFMKPNIIWGLKIFTSLHDNPDCISGKAENIASCSEIMRNFGWILWGIASLIGLIAGLGLTWWGRRVQQESHLQERFEKATDMLSSEVELTRIGACQSLINLGKSSESMKIQCVQLLFAFISNPYLENKKRERYLKLNSDAKDVYLNKLFPTDSPLRGDIFEAAVSFSIICDYYREDEKMVKRVELPSYFWKNKEKGYISLTNAILSKADWIKANLKEANLEKARLLDINSEGADLQDSDLRKARLFDINFNKADLRDVDFQKAGLWNVELNGADLRGVNFRGAKLTNVNLNGADISWADMRKVKNLTKEQILSAKWGYDDDSYSGPPLLSRKLARDADVKKWLDEKAYDKRKKSVDIEILKKLKKLKKLVNLEKPKGKKNSKVLKKSKEAKKSKGKAKKPKGSKKKPNNPSQ